MDSYSVKSSSKSLRIGIDARLSNESGVGRYIRNLVAQLLKIDTKNEYVLFIKDELTSNSNQVRNNKNWKVVRSNIRWHSLKEQLQFSSIINKEKLDLVHFPYFSVPILYNRPFIVTIHDLIIHAFDTGEASTLPLPLYKFKRFGYKYVIAQAAKKAQKIITVSHATKDEIVQRFNVRPEKIVVTYEGVDDHLMNSKSRIISNGKYFLYVGNAYPHKNLETLITAFENFVAGHHDVQLILVGKEDFFYHRLKEKVLLLDSRWQIVFKGFVSDEDLSNLYQNALALIAPSKMEGFDLPTLEAMAQKCLVIASDIAVHKEICQDLALYFSPNSSSELAQKLKIVYDSSHAFNKMLGYERAKEFSWKKMAQETLKVFESGLGIRPGQ